MTARAPTRPVELRHTIPGEGSALKDHRPAFFGEARDYVRTPVYDRYLLGPGNALDGPAIVEEQEATVILPPHAHATVDEYWNLIVDLGGASAMAQNGKVLT